MIKRMTAPVRLPRVPRYPGDERARAKYRSRGIVGLEYLFFESNG